MTELNVETRIADALVDLENNRPPQDALGRLKDLELAALQPGSKSRLRLARGIALNRLGYFEEALGELLEAQSIATGAKDGRTASIAWRQIGLVHSWRGNAREAAFAIIRAIANANAAQAKDLAALATLDMARAHIEIGRSGEAIALISLALASGEGQLATLEVQRATINRLQALVAANITTEAAELIQSLSAEALPRRLRHLADLEAVTLHLKCGELVAAENIVDQIDLETAGESASFERIEWLFAKCEFERAAGRPQRTLDLIDDVIRRCLADDLASREVRARLLRAQALDDEQRKEEACDELLIALRRASSRGLSGYEDTIRERLLERNAEGRAVLTLNTASRRRATQVERRFVRRNALGSGAYGKVVRAYDIESGSEVALKTIPIADTLDPSLRSGLLDSARREVLAASTILHPGVSRVLGFFLDADSDAFIASEFVSGPTLRDVIQTQQIRDNVALIINRIAYALTAVHAAGVVHGDLKPENVVLRENLWPVLIDFGSAVSTNAQRALTKTYGTKGYAPPEQVSGKKIDHKADLFALGVIAFEIICGERPRNIAQRSGLRSWLQKDPVVTELESHRIAPLHAQLIAACLRVRPATRPRSAAVIAQALAR